MKTVSLFLLLATLPAILTPVDSSPAPRARAHVYIATRVIPYFGEETAAQGMIVLDANDGEGAICVVGLSPQIIDEICSMNKKVPISYETK